MTKNASELGQRSAISASWERCEHKHRLARSTLRPILRLQSTEVRPRSEELIERTGGRLGIFRQVAEIAVRAGHCFSIADADGILVRREGKVAEQSEYERNGISLGSCWDERIGGTNGVSMALAHDRPFTVRGCEHYFSKFAPFACTGVPIHDAANQKIGVVNLATVDRGVTADYLFDQQLLGAAAGRIQRILFQRHFSDSMLVTVSSPTDGAILGSNELVAVDETGLILGSTTMAHRLIGLSGPAELLGRSFEDLFGADAFALDRKPELAPYVRTGEGRVVRLSRHHNDRNALFARDTRPLAEPALGRSAGPQPMSLGELSTGSTVMAEQFVRAEVYLKHAVPFIVQGETGTGKTALVEALHVSESLADVQVVSVDCAVLGESDHDRAYIAAIVEQARIFGLLNTREQGHLSLVFDNIHEMPGFAQAALRKLLQERESACEAAGTSPARSGTAVIATTRRPLLQTVQAGEFREDLYYLLANAIIVLPRLQKREKLKALVKSITTRLAGRPVEITLEAMDAIRSHGWPGNVRELRNALQQALLEGDGLRISLMDLKSSTIFNESTHQPAAATRWSGSDRGVPYSEENQIVDALIGARWNVSQAARNLGMGRATIHRKIKQFKISRPS